jgi:hypothetical protein
MKEKGADMQRIDYGPIEPEMAGVLEGLRRSMPSERRLVMAKLLARTVAADGDPAERTIGLVIDQAITDYFRGRYPT